MNPFILVGLVAAALGLVLFVISIVMTFTDEAVAIRIAGVVIILFAITFIIGVQAGTATREEIVTISSSTSHKSADNFQWCVPGKSCGVTKP